MHKKSIIWLYRSFDSFVWYFYHYREALCVSRPKLLTTTPYPKVSYSYEYTYIYRSIYIYKLLNSDLRYLFFCFVALCYLVYMYYKVYIKLLNARRKDRSLFWLKSSALTYYIRCKVCAFQSVSLLLWMFFFTALLPFVNIIVFLGRFLVL